MIYKVINILLTNYLIKPKKPTMWAKSAEVKGFEPLVRFRTLVFQASTFDRSDIPILNIFILK